MPSLRSGICRNRSGAKLQCIANACHPFVDLVEEEKPRHAEIVKLAHDQLQGGDFLLVRLGDNNGNVACCKDRLCLERELD